MSFLDHIYVVSTVSNRQCHFVWVIISDELDYLSFLLRGCSVYDNCLGKGKNFFDIVDLRIIREHLRELCTVYHQLELILLILNDLHEFLDL